MNSIYLIKMPTFYLKYILAIIEQNIRLYNQALSITLNNYQNNNILLLQNSNIIVKFKLCK